MTNIQLKLNLKECEILFGIPHSPTAHLDLINFVILMTKWYINKQRSENKELYFIELLQTIKYKIKTYIIGNNMNDRMNKPWQDMLDDIL